MPSGIVAGYFNYPNLAPFISGEYTCSHGTSPGTVLIRTHPSAVGPVAGGQVTIGDGRKALNLRGCKLMRFTAERSDQGVEWLLELEDGRWRWRDGRIDGLYNQLDPHGKLIPRQIKSPTELAKLCLQKMGVNRFIVDMPDGIIGTAFVNNIPDFLPVGVNFPAIGINPPVNWYADNPAGCLSQLAELTGRRIVYDPVDERVLVVRPGLGDELPDGHISNVSPSMVAPETPDAVQVVGDPTRWEAFLELYAVGLEWDGSIRPINELSYAPIIPARQHIVVYEVTKVTPGEVYGVLIEPDNGVQGPFALYTAGGGDTITTVVEAIRDKINALTVDPFAGNILATATATQVFISGKVAGFLFDVIPASAGGEETVYVKKAGAKAKRSWDFSGPPLFGNIVATDRLTRVQAIALAQRSVFRMFRITGRDATTLTAPINIPGYGPCVRQDLIISDTLVEQVVPEPGDKRFVDRDGKPLIRNLYDGYSRDKPAEVYGSVCNACVNSGEIWFIGDGALGGGAAAIGGLADGGPRVAALEIKNAKDTITYTVTIKLGDASLQYSHLVTGVDTTQTIVDALKTQILAEEFFTGKLTATTTTDKLFVSGLKANVAFTITTDTDSQYAAVTVIKTGSGGAAPVPTDSTSGSVMTPAGDSKGSSVNTDPSDRVYVDFSVDPTWQMITFSAPVWYAGPGLTIQEPKLFLRCAVQVRNAFTQQLVAYSDTKLFRPGPAVRVVKRPDVQLNVIGDYKIARKKGAGDAGPGGPQYCWQLKNTRLLEADAVVRARYYLVAEILQFQVKGGLTIDYNGIEPVRMDGKTQQVTYRVEGGVGTMTTASSNMEHSTWLPPYPARRRAENLAAVARNQLAGGRVDNPAGNTASQNPNASG